MRIEEDLKLDFSDVLIRPKRSDAKSRADVNLTRSFKVLNPNVKNRVDFGIPIMASNLDTTGTMLMATSLAKLNTWTCLHKFYSIDQLLTFYKTVDRNVVDRTFYSLGISDDDINKLASIVVEVPVHFICIDVANGYSEYFTKKVRQIRNICPNSVIMAGNVVTPEMVSELLLSGSVDIVKVGIGPGSLCTTRIKTGVGYPQLSAIIECADAAHGLNGLICADGGCVYPGDVAKAFAAGADFVMIGGMLAGSDECEGEWITRPEAKYLKTYGMSSKEAMEKHYGDVAEHRTSEGRCVEVRHKGPVKNIMLDILGGLRSACTYVGSMELKDLSKCTTFIRVNKTHNMSMEK